MALSKHRIGEFVQPYSIKCGIPNLTNDEVSGINRDKEFFEPSTQVGSDTSKYKVVEPGSFACNLMHVGRDCVLPIAENTTEKNKVVSPAYTTFYFMDNDFILKDYFFMKLKCSELDRYFWFHTDSSVRDGMSWDEFVDVELELPDLTTQQKYVAVYKAMVENQKCYEAGLDDLKLTCDAYIEDLRRNIGTEPIGPYIRESDERNSGGLVILAQGVSNEKLFITPKQVAENKESAKVVRTGQFAYNRATTRNGEKISIAYRDGEDCVVSSAYGVFEITDKKLNPEYLMLWFNRTEFDRYARYMSKGSAHEFFEFSDMQEVEVPIPDIKIQEAIIHIYKTLLVRKEINEEMKAKIKEMCPILIKGSLEEAATA